MAHYEGGVPEMATPGSLPPGVGGPSRVTATGVTVMVTKLLTAISGLLPLLNLLLLLILLLTPPNRSLPSLFLCF